MTPYIITFLIVAILAAIATQYQYVEWDEDGNEILYPNKNYILFAFLTAVVLIIVAGLRYDVGTDYMSYTTSYIIRAESAWNDLLLYNEPGLGIISYFSRFIKDDYATVFFNVSIITVGLYVWTLARYSNNFLIAVTLYVMMGAWHGSFNGIRQYLAAAILFAGHRLIFEHKMVKYMIVVLIASLFHTTALIMIPVYFILIMRNSKFSIWVLIISSVVMRYGYDFFFSIMSNLKGHDQSKYAYMQTDVNIFRVLVAFAPVVLFLLCSEKLRLERENDFYFRMLVLNAAFMFSMSGSAYLARIGIYTDIYAAIAIPRALLGYNSSSQKLIKFLIVILYFIFWMYELYSRIGDYAFQWIFNR